MAERLHRGPVPLRPAQRGRDTAGEEAPEPGPRGAAVGGHGVHPEIVRHGRLQDLPQRLRGPPQGRAYYILSLGAGTKANPDFGSVDGKRQPKAAIPYGVIPEYQYM